jgi:biotin synthase
MNIWKLSAGTASVIGKKIIKSDAVPTTAYIMIGEKCRNNCLFCAQARESKAKDSLLSRVTWPEYADHEVVDGIVAAYNSGKVKRTCLQVVNTDDSWNLTLHALDKLQEKQPMPVCVSSHITSLGQAKLLIATGAERICIALDAATPKVYKQVKYGSWDSKWQLLEECADNLPGRITTHLIVGLGETEAEMVETIVRCLAKDITVGLFAFTPLKGTDYAGRTPPDIGSYRRIQIALYLLKQGHSPDVIRFRSGRIVGFDVPNLRNILAEGRAFETTGCPDCNRPYYNERPGGVMYNYPRPLTSCEVAQALVESGIVEGAYNHDMAGG